VHDILIQVKGIGAVKGLFSHPLAKSAKGWGTRLESRNFLTHLHDPQKCHLIVCWEHNWPDCPLEVVELKSAVKRIGRSDDREIG
jgi:hypothetical protein